MQPQRGQLGDFLSLILQEKHLTFDDVKRRLNISSSVLNQLLYYGERQNARQPNTYVLRMLAVMLDVNEKKLLHLAGYQLTESTSRRSQKRNVSLMEQYKNLGDLLEDELRSHGISSNKLAQLAGVSQATIHNLLKQGHDANVPGPHPRVLRAVCEVLGLNQLEVFQLVGYIDPNYSPDNYVASGTDH